MLTLNLINKNKSDIDYNIFMFPDGEVQVELKDLNRKESPIDVVTRIADPTSIFILQQVADILNRQGIEFRLDIKYLMGMRMDRVMEFSRPYTLKIMADVINSMGAKQVRLLEVHSSKALRLIDRSFTYYAEDVRDLNEEYVLVLPDEGAIDRYISFPDTVYCKKTRDVTTGKLSGFTIINPDKVREAKRPLLILDDLCDGGGTFLGIAEKIREINPEVDLNIRVTHAVNRSGLMRLSYNFNHVFITNSYEDWTNLPENVSIQDIA